MLRSALRTALAAALLPALSLADELALSVERVVVFKDGTALVVKRASGVPDAFGRVHTDAVPDAAALGCFWAAVDHEGGAPADLRIGVMRAERVEEKLPAGDPVAVRSMLELLRANAGRDVRLRLRGPDGPEVSGVIAEVLADAGLVVVKRAGTGADKESATALPVSDVHTVLGEDLATRRDADPAVESKKRLTLELARGDGPAPGGEGAAPVSLRLFYFTPGLRWIPTYRLTGDLELSGRLALQAELLNELEDLQEAEVDLVVGVPNFRFGRMISPLALEGAMRNALLQAAPDLMGAGGALSNALFTQRAGEFRALDAAPGAEPSTVIAPELAATGEQDLYVYHAGPVTLPKGARSTMPLWEHEVALDHLYTYDLAIRRGSPYAYGAVDQGPGASPLALSSNAVWHQLRLANATPHPWTTGPLLLLQGLLPLGQELLTYTPGGGDVLVPITVAVDVRGSYSEEELQREERALTHNGHQYTRLTKRLTLKVKNHRAKPASTRIHVELGGRVYSVSEGGTVVHGEPRSSDWDQRNLFDHVLNPHSEMSFEAELAPGEERTFTLEVELYAS